MAAAPRAGLGARHGEHPRQIRAGQVFTPLKKGPKLRLTVQLVVNEWARVRREDGSQGRVSIDRLLALNDQGGGAYYRFHGWKPLARGYRVDFEVLVVDEATCIMRIPEWDPDEPISQPLGILTPGLRHVGASGSCMANMGAQSAAALNIHSCKKESAPKGSRAALPPYPGVLARGQKFRRRRDGQVFHLLDPDQPRVKAWSGRRVVRLDRAHLLEFRDDGTGRWYDYLGGGTAAAREVRGRS